MNQSISSTWLTSVTNDLSGLYKQFLVYLPQIFYAIAICLIGLLVAHLLGRLAQKLVLGFEYLFKGYFGEKRLQLQQSYAYALRQIVFWVVLLYAIDFAATALGWLMIANWLDSFLNYLPNIILSLLIILVGYLLSLTVKNALLHRAVGHNATHSGIIITAVHWGIVFIAVLLGLQNLGLDVTALAQVAVVAVASVFGGAALAFSLGARTLTENVIGAQYAKKYYQVGEKITFLDMEGELLEITQTSIIIQTADKVAVIPAKCFHENVSLIRHHKSEQIT